MGNINVNFNVNSEADLNAGVDTTPSLQTAENLAKAFQEKLISGTNIKTINGGSVLGNGDITVGGADGTGLVQEWYAGFSGGYALNVLVRDHLEPEQLYISLVASNTFVLSDNTKWVKVKSGSGTAWQVTTPSQF